jgi:hypothetical protein
MVPGVVYDILHTFLLELNWFLLLKLPQWLKSQMLRKLVVQEDFFLLLLLSASSSSSSPPLLSSSPLLFLFLFLFFSSLLLSSSSSLPLLLFFPGSTLPAVLFGISGLKTTVFSLGIARASIPHRVVWGS